MATTTSTRRRSNSLTLFNRKKIDHNHRLHIAAALIPTQAFAIAPAVRCAEPTQQGDPRFSKLNRTAISNSLVRRSMDKSLDQADWEYFQQLSVRSTVNDDSLLPQRRANNRSSLPPYDSSAVNAEPVEPSTRSIESEGKVIRVSIDPLAISAPLRSTVAADPAPSSSRSRNIDEEVVVKLPRKTKTFVAPTNSKANANRAPSGKSDTRAPNKASVAGAANMTQSQRSAERTKGSLSFTWVSDTDTDLSATNRDRNLDTVLTSTVGSELARTSASQSDGRRRSVAFNDRDEHIGDESEEEDESDDSFGGLTDEETDDEPGKTDASPASAQGDPKKTTLGTTDVPSLPIGFEGQPSAMQSIAGSEGAEDYTDFQPDVASGNASAETAIARPRKNDTALRAEVKVLQDTVQRLSVELSRYQAAVAIQSGEVERYLQVNRVRAALGPNEPLPVWLIDQKYLSPLFASYDTLIKDKDRLLKESKERLEEFEMRLQKAVKANPFTGGVFASQLVSSNAVQNGVPNNWPEIVRQCKYVIEENAQLKTTVDRQTKEIHALEKCHVQEVTRLQDQIKLMEQEHLRTHGLLRDMMDRHIALEEAARKSTLSDQALAEAPKKSPDNKAADQTALRLQQTEAALKDAMAKHKELLLQAKGFAQSIVKLSSENKLLQDEKAKCDKRLSKMKHKITALQGKLSQWELKDCEKDILLKDLISINGDIVKQRNELAASLQKASSLKSQMQERESADKDLKLKWLEAMLQNSVDRIDQEETERHKLEQNVHAVWESASRDRGYNSRLSASGSSVLLRTGVQTRERSPSRPTSLIAGSDPNRLDSASLRNSDLFSGSLRLG